MQNLKIMARKTLYFFIIVLITVSCGSNQNKTDKQEEQTADTISVKDQQENTGNENGNHTAVLSKRPPIKRQDSMPKINMGKIANNLFKEGVQAYEREKYEEGIEKFNKVLQLAPENADAFFNLGMGQFYTDNYKEALNNFRKAYEKGSDDTLSSLYCGLSCYYMNDLEKAIEYFNETIELKPDFANAYFNRGTARGKLKKYNEAVEDLSKAIQYDPGYSDAYVNRGNSYYFLGKRELACKDWQKAKQLGATNVDKVLDAYCKQEK